MYVERRFKSLISNYLCLTPTSYLSLIQPIFMRYLSCPKNSFSPFYMLGKFMYMVKRAVTDCVYFETFRLC